LIQGTPGETPRSTPRDDATPLRRRDLRAERTGLVLRPPVAAPAVASSPSAARPARTAGVKRTAVNMAVITVATGLIATMALPGTSLVADPVANAENSIASGNAEAIAQLMATEAQSVDIASDVAVAAAFRDDFGATTVEELAAARAAEERAAQIAAAAAAPAYTGPGVSDFLANPPYPAVDLDQVVQVALQYQGTPYLFGGTTPAGFDCSGFVQFVYAQFGLAIPRTVVTQAAFGTRISREDARPGDVVIMPGHNGFYMGNGMILDSPRAGSVVSVRPIWTDNYYIVRFGA